MKKPPWPSRSSAGEVDGFTSNHGRDSPIRCDVFSFLRERWIVSGNVLNGVAAIGIGSIEIDDSIVVFR